MIIPCSEDVFYLAGLADKLEPKCKIFCPPQNLLYIIHNKQQFTTFSAAIGLRTPRSELYQGQNILPDYFNKEYILKQVYSRGGQKIICAKGGVKPSEYGIRPDGSWLLQEKVKGELLCSCSVIHHGKVVAHLTYSPTVQLGSVGVVFKQIEQENIRKWVSHFSQSTNYHGIVSFDFIVDAQGVAWAIECNPRPTSGVHLFNHAILGEAIYSPSHFGESISRRWNARLTLAMLSALPAMARNPKLFVEKIPDIVRSRDIINSWKDPGPFFYQFICYGYVLYCSWRTGMSLTSIMIDGVEWNGEKNDVTPQSVI